MDEKLKILERQLNMLNHQKAIFMREKQGLIENSSEVKRYIRINFEERKLEREIAILKENIDEELMMSCHHAFINTDDKGNQYCVKCGLSTESPTDKEVKIYEETKENSIVINTDYVCKTEVVKKICSYIVEQDPYISDEKLVHFVAVAIHNMQTKKKSEKVKFERAKRLYLRPIFLKRSKML